jgi:hypothetical protein
MFALILTLNPISHFNIKIRLQNESVHNSFIVVLETMVSFWSCE